MRVKKIFAVLLSAMLTLTCLPVCSVTAAAAESDAVYSVDEAYINGDFMTFTVFAESSGEYAANFVADSGEATETELVINGIPSVTVQIPSEENILTLNKGLNTICLAYTQSLTAIELPGCAPKAERGVTAEYVTYEAEGCETNAAVLEDSRVYQQIASEASGRQAVRLESEGQYQWRLWR